MKKEALTTLKRAAEAGFSEWDLAARDPDLACLREEPEFKPPLEVNTVWENHLPRATILAARMPSRSRIHPEHHKTYAKHVDARSLAAHLNTASSMARSTKYPFAIFGLSGSRSISLKEPTLLCNH